MWPYSEWYGLSHISQSWKYSKGLSIDQFGGAEIIFSIKVPFFQNDCSLCQVDIKPATNIFYIFSLPQKFCIFYFIFFQKSSFAYFVELTFNLQNLSLLIWLYMLSNTCLLYGYVLVQVHECPCTCVSPAHIWRQRTTYGSQFSASICNSQELNWGCQACWQMLLSAELSH